MHLIVPLSLLKLNKHQQDIWGWRHDASELVRTTESGITHASWRANTMEWCQHCLPYISTIHAVLAMNTGWSRCKKNILLTCSAWINFISTHSTAFELWCCTADSADGTSNQLPQIKRCLKPKMNKQQLNGPQRSLGVQQRLPGPQLEVDDTSHV